MDSYLSFINTSKPEKIQFRRRLLSNDSPTERQRHFRQLEQRATQISDKSCYIFNVAKTRGETVLTGSPKVDKTRHVDETYDLKSASLGILF